MRGGKRHYNYFNPLRHHVSKKHNEHKILTLTLCESLVLLCFSGLFTALETTSQADDKYIMR